MLQPGRVEQKVALVTGAASGIGRATAILLAKEGAPVALTDIADAGQAVADEIRHNGGKALFVRLDVSDEAAWKGCIGQVLDAFGKLDVAVNNAGIASARPVADMTLAEWAASDASQPRWRFPRDETRHSGHEFRHRRQHHQRGSASGIKASAGASAYCASKAAVRMFSKTAALECAAANLKIRVNVVSPGGVKTPIWQKMDFWPGLVAQHGDEEGAWKALAGPSPDGFLSADEIPQAILFLASDESAYMNAGELVIDRGYSA
jgi:3(or 17)beta-hydroxysteroid dehydrogenase